MACTAYFGLCSDLRLVWTAMGVGERYGEWDKGSKRGGKREEKGRKRDLKGLVKGEERGW